MKIAWLYLHLAVAWVGTGWAPNLFPRPSTPPVFDHLQYAKCCQSTVCFMKSLLPSFPGLLHLQFWLLAVRKNRGWRPGESYHVTHVQLSFIVTPGNGDKVGTALIVLTPVFGCLWCLNMKAEGLGNLTTWSVAWLRSWVLGFNSLSTVLSTVTEKLDNWSTFQREVGPTCKTYSGNHWEMAVIQAVQLFI